MNSLVRNPEDVITCYDNVKQMMVRDKMTRSAALKCTRRQLTSLRRAQAIYQLYVTRRDKSKEVRDFFLKTFSLILIVYIIITLYLLAHRKKGRLPC